MAIMKSTSGTLKPLTVDKFLGLNMPKSGDIQLLLGESGNMTNCYITKDYNLAKIEGYLQLMTTVDATKSIQGSWYGNIGGQNYLLFSCNGHIRRFTDDYWLDDTTWGTWEANTIDLGTLTDAPTSFFAFNDNVYILNGTEYKKWTGSGVITDVVGYIPKILVATKPLSGEGTEYEGINLLIGKKRLTYKADNTTIYTLPETNIDSVDSVYVNGVLKTVTTDYTVNLATGKVTFTTGPAPIADEDEVEIYWTKGVGTRDIVTKNRFAFLFGKSTDTRVFLYGHTIQNQRIFSSLADGLPSAEYFTSANIDLIGSSAFAITDMIPQQTNFLVCKENETYYSYYDVVQLDTIDVVNYPIALINGTRGSIVFNQGQLLNNDPYTIDTTLIKWTPTTVKDERNMKEMGARIQKDLNEYDLSKSKTIDRQNKFEMWISIGKKVWIYNYKLDVFSRLELDHEPTCFLIIDGDIYFGTTTGQIMKISDKYLTFNGTAIDSHWEMNMYNFGADYLTKTLNKSWITLAAQSNVSIDVKYKNETNQPTITETIARQIMLFNNVKYSNFTFNISNNPKTFPIKLKSKKFTYLKLIIDNNSTTTTFVVLNFTLKAEYGGQVK